MAQHPSSLPRIVHVVRQFSPGIGGLEDVVGNLARDLAARGYPVRVVTLDSLFSQPDRVLPERETVDGVEIVRIPWSGSTRYPLAPEVFRHVADADVVHVHAIDFFFDAFAFWRLAHRRAMVVTTHGGFFHTPKYAAIKKVWFRTLTRLSASRYDRVVGCSQSDEAVFRQIVGKHRLTTIENGVDTAKFADLAPRAPTRRIVTIGRFSVNKRLDHLLDAMVGLKALEPGWHLDIVGAPSDLTGEDLIREIAARGLGSEVSLHIGLPVVDVARIVSEVSFFASASDYEGFGLVAIEAMSAGLVPVLHANDAYRVLADRHPVIALTDFSKPDQAARALLTARDRLAADPDIVRAQAIHAANAYSWKGVTDRYIEVYNAALAAY